VTAREALVLGLVLGATRDGLEVLGYTRELDATGGTLRILVGPGRVVVVTVREVAADAEVPP